MRTLSHRTMLLGCCLLLAGAVASGQGRGGGGAPGGGPPGGGGGGGGMGGGMPGGPGGGSRPTFGSPPTSGGATPRSRYPGDSAGEVRGAASQLGPPGRWWDDKGFAKTLGLSRDQQKKMDTIFNANKAPILESYKALQKEEAALQKLTREKKLDEARIFAGIDAVAQSRAALDKAYSHVQLLVRQEMDTEQNARMEKYQEPVAEE